MDSRSYSNFFHITILSLSAIFGTKKRLRFGVDDEKIEQLLDADCSDLELDDFSNDEVDFEIQQDIQEIEDAPEDILSEEDSDDEPLSVIRERITTERVYNRNRMNWKILKNFIPPNFVFEEPVDNVESRRDWKVQDYLKMYLDDEILQNICDCTNVKFLEEKGKSMNLILPEIKKFIAITILMSCLKYPQVRMYWAKTTKVSAIATAMTRDRYFLIRNNLKVVIDNNVTPQEKTLDRLYKIRPLIDRIRKGCLMLPRYSEVAIDEQMIPFTGVCRMKQFIRGKPNPEGLKNFVCATPDGLILDFEIYQGKNTFLHEKSKNLGIGPSSVIRLTETLKEGTHIFIDRYFTTIPLLEYMLEKKMTVTGTIMKSRIPRSVHLTPEKTMARLGRGSSEMSVRADGKISVVHWYDMKSVLIASTALQVEPQDECKRWSKKDTKYINIPRPNIVSKYNSCMGGIDLIDRMISYYRISTRTKKWTVKTILHLMDLAVANSWILYRNDRKKLGDRSAEISKFLDFKISYANYLFEIANLESATENKLPSIITRNSFHMSVSQVSSPSASKGKNLHLPIVASELKNAVRCKNPGCKLKTKFYCEKCTLFLCLTGSNNCFRNFHLHNNL